MVVTLEVDVWGYLYGSLGAEASAHKGWRAFPFLQLPGSFPAALFPLFRRARGSGLRVSLRLGCEVASPSLVFLPL